jgi:type II secretory pathway component PulK
VDAVTADDRGQALVLAVLALGLAAATIVGLQAAQDRILRDAHERRAGEAAVEAAGAALADAQIGFTGSLDDFAADPLVAERARAAAEQLSALNGGAPVRDLTIDAGTREIEVALSIGAHRQRAAVETTCCRP